MLTESSNNYTFKGEGEMAKRIREMDWSRTLLGPVENWPQSLKTAVNLMLATKFPMMVHWGPQLVHFYNDGYAAILQNKHPGALGQPAYPWWSEIWDLLDPIFQQVWTGQTTFFQDQLVTPNRRGFTEEAYFTYSHSPIYDESGKVAGILATALETTNEVVSRRRLAMLGHLAGYSAQQKEVDVACQTVADSLATNPEDIPFALIYLINTSGTELNLKGKAGNSINPEASPSTISLTTENTPVAPNWPVSPVIKTGEAELVENLKKNFTDIFGGVWPEPCRQAIILPITRPGQSAGELPYGVIIAGISPRRPWDADYYSFYNLVAEQTGRAVGNAHAITQERKNAEALAQLNIAKTSFFNNVSHEFRTPLTLMLGPLESLLNQEKLATEQQEALNLISRNTLRLLHLVNNLLTFSQVEARRLQATFSATDLAALTTELSAAFRSAIEAVELHFVVDCPSLPEPVYVDVKLYESILFNLLSNALKFTFKGTITVTLQAVGTHAILRVSDTGNGIAPEDLPHIFTRFHRVNGVPSRTHEGSGIGLALVEDLVKLHNGTITIESEIGRGSTFTVSLPLGKLHLPPEQVCATNLKKEGILGQESLESSYLHWISAAAEEKSSKLPEAAVTSKPLILVVDDNGDMRQYLRRILEEDYQLTLADNGLTGWEQILHRKPDLILTDVMMPHMNGYDLVKKIRSDYRFRNLPVILISALTGPDMQATGIETGADDYVIKPFSTRELKARIKVNLQLAQLRLELETIINGLDAGFGLVNANGSFTYLNQKLENILEQDKAQLLGYSVQEVLIQPNQIELSQRISQHAALRSADHFEFYRPNSDQWYEVLLAPYQDSISVLFLDVTTRKNGEQRLQIALKEANVRNLTLLKLNETLDNLVHIIAHDLRSPANNLKILLELQQVENKPEKKAEILSMLAGEVKRLQATLNGLMTIIQTQGDDNLGAKPLRFEAILRDITTELAEVILGQVAHIDANFEKGETIIYPEAYLTSILKNLISNALKYRSPDRPVRVQISTMRQAEQVVLTVQDNGVGMDLNRHRAQLFEPFKRISTNTEGTGLGLYLVQNIVEKNGGTVKVESQLGQGTTFTIYLQDYSIAEQ